MSTVIKNKKIIKTLLSKNKGEERKKGLKRKQKREGGGRKKTKNEAICKLSYGI